MIEQVIKNLNFEDAKFILIARKSHCVHYRHIMDKLIKAYNVEFIFSDLLTEGAACTVLFARRLINNDIPLLIANSDQIIDINIKEMIDYSDSSNLDGCILTFKADDPKWSYVKVKDNIITELKEKQVISNDATVGIYYFRKGKIFVDNAIDMIINNDRVNNEFYVAPTYNYAINNNFKFGIYEIKNTQMHGIGTPEDLVSYLSLVKR